MHMMYVPKIVSVLLVKATMYIKIGKHCIPTLLSSIQKHMRGLFEKDMIKKGTKDGTGMNGSIYFVN